MLSADVAGLSGSPAPDGPAATAFRAEQTGGDRTRTNRTNTQDVIEVNQATKIVEPCLPSPAKVPPSGPGWTTKSSTTHSRTPRYYGRVRLIIREMCMSDPARVQGLVPPPPENQPPPPASSGFCIG